MTALLGRRSVIGALLGVAVALTALIGGACSVAESVFRQPLPPPETLGLQALLLEGGGMMPGTQVVRLGWNPPDDTLGIDLVVMEQAKTPDGPWEEVSSRAPSRGFHEETSIYQPGNFYYFRAFMTRGEGRGPAQRADVRLVPQPWRPSTHRPRRYRPPQQLPHANPDPQAGLNSDARSHNRHAHRALLHRRPHRNAHLDANPDPQTHPHSGIILDNHPGSLMIDIVASVIAANGGAIAAVSRRCPASG